MILRCSSISLRAINCLRFGRGLYNSQSAGHASALTCSVQALRYAPHSRKAFFKRRWRPVNLEGSTDSKTPSQPGCAHPHRPPGTRTDLIVSRSEATVSELEDELLHDISHGQGTSALGSILHELIEVRKVKPTHLHYTAFLLRQQGSENGSSQQIGDLLQKMDGESVQMTEGLASAALQALVIHPDLAIMLDVLHRCEEKWIKPTLKMQHFIAAIYMRLNQPELAIHWLEKIESKQTQGSSLLDKNEAELWLYVLFLVQIIQNTSGEELFMTICYRLHDSLSTPMREMDIPFALWNQAFSWAVQNQNLYAVKWIWQTFIVRQYVKPDLELLSEAQRLASKQKDQALADGCKALIKFRTDKSHLSMKIQTSGVFDQKRRLAEAHNDPVMRYARIPSGQRFDPWAMLTEDMDPGVARPRIEHLLSRKIKRNAAQLAADQASERMKEEGVPRTTIGGLKFIDVNIEELYAPFEGYEKSSESHTDLVEELVSILRQRHRNSEDENLTRELLNTFFKPKPNDRSKTALPVAKARQARTATSRDSVTGRDHTHELARRSDSGTEKTWSSSPDHIAEQVVRTPTRTRALGEAISKHKS